MADPDHPPKERRNSWTRLVATLVLVPTVPLLFVSIAALVGFYVAPARFERLLERLPGTDLLRVALIFAPATLLGVVILAVLYAREQAAPGPERAPVRPAPARPRRVAALVLLPSVPLLLGSAALLTLSFVAPGRFDLLMERLPGGSHLRPILQVAPYVFFLVTLIAATYAFGEGGPALGRAGGTASPSMVRLLVGLVLIPAVPLLLLSLAGLGVLYTAPERAERVLAQLGGDAFVRLALILVPAALLALVVVASLYLLRPREAEALRVSRPAGGLTGWVLAAGLGLSTVVGTSLLAAIAYLLLR